MDAILEEKANHMARIDVDGDQVMDGAFVAEEPIGLDEETLGIASLRREIREHILEGRIDAARQMLDVKFPSVLNVPPKTRLGTSSIPTTLQTPSAPTQTDSSSSSQQTTHPQSPFSLDPRHLSLNLHIQEFIESMRTIPLSRSYPASSSTQHIGASTFADGAPSIPLSDPETFVPKAQQLALLVSELPSALDRDTYSMELDGVSALMAYSVPESSPVSKYMGMERREAVAEQINSAILCQTIIIIPPR
ncbi:hypothetical protein FRB99_004012 [Tulasnella sp. 403]|nr:hypothetical protein FRB99_004012 [Tulasnella sp. 403]